MTFAQFQDVSYTLLHEDLRQSTQTSAQASEILNQGLTTSATPSMREATVPAPTKPDVPLQNEKSRALLESILANTQGAPKRRPRRAK